MARKPIIAFASIILVLYVTWNHSFPGPDESTDVHTHKMVLNRFRPHPMASTGAEIVKISTAGVAFTATNVKANVTGIPKICHRVYGLWSQDGDHGLPPKYAAGIERWKAMYPDWQHRLWNKSTSYAFVKEHYPLFYPVFLRYSREVQRADALRYLLVYHYGGFYFDIDILPKLHLQGLLDKYSDDNVFMFEETRLSAFQAAAVGNQHKIRHGEPEDELRIANYMFASSPRHPFTRQILIELEKRSSLPIREDYDVLFSTGPDVLSTLVARLQQNFPFNDSAFEMFGFPRHDSMSDVRVVYRPEDQLYFDHLVHGSWRQH